MSTSVNLVKITRNEDGDIEKRGWCLVVQYGDSPRTVCYGEVFGQGEGSAVYKEKTGTIKDVTCENCLKVINWYKSILKP